MRKIVTSFWAKPIPPRQFDWEAYFDGDEPDDDGHMKVGYGSTEQEAVLALLADEDMDAERGTPLADVVLDIGDAIVVWQPDGEVKTLWTKPSQRRPAAIPPKV